MTLAWLEENASSLPADVVKDITSALDLASKMRALQVSHRRLQRQILRAMGLIPSSERRGRAQKPASAGEPRQAKKKSIDPAQRLLQIEQRSARLSDWHKQCARRHNSKAKDAQMKRHKIEEVPLSPEDEAAAHAEHLAAMARAKSGGGADPSFAPHAETLMHGASNALRRQTVNLDVARDTLPKGAVINQIFHESRERIDFQMSLTALDVNVEKLAISTPKGDTLVAADMDEFGPPRMRVTWAYLVNMALLVSQYVMPLNRFAKLTSSAQKKFTAGEISRYFLFVAEHFASIYIQLGQSLAQAPILAGDDTSSLVLEVSSAQAKEANGSTETAPWAAYADIKAADAAASAGEQTIAVLLAQAFGFSAQRKNGSGAKRGFNTTTLSGRTEAENPQSTVIFYRSHLGGFGNLLDVILPHRKAQSGDVIIQSDLSTVNLVSDEKVRKRFTINLAGCSSHARRPFALHEADDPDVCAMILHAFKAIPIYENLAGVYGRNASNVGALRDADQRQNWEVIREQCAGLIERWPRTTPLGEGARYVLRHYDKLTYYLNHPRVAPDNNFSERMLRLEKLIANNSMFRKSLQGRFALDIVRTILQTCIAAEVDSALYLVWVMRMPKEAVAKDPAAFTPLEFKRWWKTVDAEQADGLALFNAAGARHFDPPR
jgi:hypothetical protein